MFVIQIPTLIQFFMTVAPNTGPYYSQLGYCESKEELRRMMESRTGASGPALKLLEAAYCPREGKSIDGCPVAKQVLNGPCFNL